MAFDPNMWYKFTDAEGNVEWHKGDNDYVEQAVVDGIPFSINEKGEWFDMPYIDNDSGHITVHVTPWFEGTDEYYEWMTVHEPYLESLSNPDAWQIEQLNQALERLGKSAAEKIKQEYQAKKATENQSDTSTNSKESEGDTQFSISSIQFEPSPEQMTQFSLALGTGISLIPMILTIIFARKAKKDIRSKKKINWYGWGFACCTVLLLFSRGLISIIADTVSIIIAYIMIKKEIDNSKGKKFVETSNSELKHFVIVYAICIVVYIILSAIGSIMSSS